MKRLLPLLLLLCLPGVHAEPVSPPEEYLAAHWYPPTLELARRHSLAMAWLLERSDEELENWRQVLDARRLRIDRLAQRHPLSLSSPADGLFGWLAYRTDAMVLPWPEPLSEPELGRLGRVEFEALGGARLPRLSTVVAHQAPAIWQELHQRLSAIEGVDADEVMAEIWRPVAEIWAGRAPDLAADPEGDPDIDQDTDQDTDQDADLDDTLDEHERQQQERWRQHGSAQAGRVLVLQAAESPFERELAIVDLVLAELDLAWSQHEKLRSTWLMLEALVRLTGVAEPPVPPPPVVDLGTTDAEPAGVQPPIMTVPVLVPVRDEVRSRAGHIGEWIAERLPERTIDLRTLDPALPAVWAQFEDAVAALRREQQAPLARAEAMTELIDGYVRLALFATDAAFYLDQPVRVDVVRVHEQCRLNEHQQLMPSREVFESCLQMLLDKIETGLSAEELVGGSAGPYAAEFLRREMSLVSWQRASYLDGHLDWLVEGNCRTPEWFNVLEWSLVTEALANWVPRRPLFFGAERWRESVAGALNRVETLNEQRELYLDCLTGRDGLRRDPVARMLDVHERALGSLAVLLSETLDEFHQVQLRSGSDIDLDGSADQTTAYRPDHLILGPCPDGNNCGARVELPISRALLNLFPNAYLLADQLRVGELKLCYEQVGWVERERRVARRQDPRVANYFGVLRFDLVGSFVRNEDEVEEVFRHRLTGAEPRHYLFAASDDAILDLDCPAALVGESVPSEVGNDRPRLVPRQLTYFVSAPTSPEAQLLAHWDRGAEWRDWFVTGSERVEVIEPGDGQDMAVEVQARLQELAGLRDRQISGQMLRPVRVGESDPLALAMTELADTTSLLRRVLELHYPLVIRHDASVRRYLTGEGGLLTRDRIRLLRDSGVPVHQFLPLGRERLDNMRQNWNSLPSALREQGQVAPELIHALERLESLERGIRAVPVSPADAEGQ